MIRTIYKKVMLEEKQRIRMEAEKEILGLFQKERGCADPKEGEEYRDKIYQAISIAEEGGFVMGFRYAVNLFLECAEERGYTSRLVV